AGTYYVAVRHSNSLVPSGDYSLVTYFNDNNDTSDGATPSSTPPEVTPDDHSNTRDGATSIEPNSTTAGDLETAGDEDYFKIVIPSRGTLVVETTGSTDTYGEFYNASGTSLQSNSNSGNFKITRDVTAGTYYVKVKHRILGTGSYSLVSRFISDDHGPRGAGTSIEPNSTTAGNIEQAGDADVFKINISRAGTLVVYTTGSTDTIGAFYKKGANLIAFDDNGGTDRNFRIERNVTAGTTYEVEVLHSDYTETGSYKLVSEFTPTPRNPRDEAIPIDLNSITSGSIDRVGDEDWFKVVIPSAGRLVAETTGTTDTKGYLYDASNSTPIATDNDSGSGRNFKISEWLEAGTYYVAVRHSNSLVPSGDY
ncbi:MAG: pre-peptidase C-terminal domain-containing protein, partial [Sulfurovum sp.]|nr:pre-peptidase C-terminal domain-containing protein [Sulfurovum sp.]